MIKGFMEERFLKTRAEREEARQQKSAGSSGTAWDRLQFEDQARSYERSIMQLITDGNTSAAQETINMFKLIVQDATSNNVLTAYEMAKSNATLSRLQGLIDEKRDTCNKPKGFKFSRKPKTGVTAVVEKQQPAAASSPLSSSLQQSEEDRSQVNNVYGYAREREVFISEPKAVFLQGCEKCEIFILPVAGSVFISDCSNCKIYVACHQLRLKNCTSVDIYVWCASTPIIECCTEMRFGPYSCWTGLLQSSVGGHHYSTHEEWVQHVGEQEMQERVKDSYKTVDDFQWLKKTPSPHWSVLPPEKWEMSARPFLQGETPTM
ncbi:tubulin-specific chaperone C [Trypanosoma theileri]|uniref:Tubulin-specific chaperone C n=1 Tax=Trypanosoma theileri TaxID=67003 RepID=A0A1X0P3G4_9TRYP|nr:tubulin-specific chaperone C [Trypanosoma theileri]ORC91486.1 tubulin-specific chaperone C [Trypanosoma theileri]